MSTASAQGGNTYYGITSILAVAILAFLFLKPAIETKLRSEGYSMPVRTLPDPEHLNPETYLRASGAYHMTSGLTINGTLTNSALHTNYKDVVVNVRFFSKSNTLIDSREYTLNGLFPYGDKKGFSLSVPKPATATTCNWQVTGATPY